MYPDQYDYYENPADTYYEDDCYNGSFDDNGWRTEESSQPENYATWAQLWVLMYNNYHEQKDQAEDLEKVQASLDRSWESQETTERVKNVVEEEVVGDNATSDSTAFDVFENVDNIELVMSKSIPSPDNLVDEDVEEEAVSDSTDPSPTIPKIIDIIGEGGVDDNTTPEPRIFENFESFESKDLMMGDFVPPSDQISHSLLVPIHLLDDDQEVDADELIFENKKHDFITTHDPFMNGKLDVINTIDEDIWKHPNMLPSDPIRLENFYWYCKPKLQAEDDTQYVSNKRGTTQLLEAALGTLHVKPVILKRYRRKDRAWRLNCEFDSGFCKQPLAATRLALGPRRGAMMFRLDHPFLQFPEGLVSSAEYVSRRDALTGRRVLEATVIDRDILRDARLWGAIEPFLHHIWTHEEASFTCRGWDRIMATDEDVVYTELLLEFLSTIHFAPRASDPRSRIVRFRLGGA
ncbi:hypothetical protein L2E82_08950 [Cichorium intybus]|uniref:Uncharacterized protein n=1 Tax=Cichorium intybus TaxID=13427 RepID=A0ACB9G956_CICIN|nr:hypothetical protein L2E82_08950 [Cichorium intybus]